MKKTIREVKQGAETYVQITTVDERFYARPGLSAATGLPEYRFVPSVTWISSFLPKGVPFFKWLASTGWDEAEAIKVAAGDKGSKVHYAIGDLLDGQTVTMEAEYRNPTTEKPESLTLEEYECLMSFRDWFLVTKPRTLAREFVVWNDEYGYAGTVDYAYDLDGGPDLWILDFKSGQHLWPSHEIQVSAYGHALPATLVNGRRVRLAILQVGYRRNARRWKFTEVQDKFPLFLAARTVWQDAEGGQKPSQKDYPLALSLGLTPVADTQQPLDFDSPASESEIEIAGEV